MRGFQRITLQPGESRTITFALRPDQLRLWNKDMKRIVEPGDFEIMVGANSADLKKTLLHVSN